MASSKPSRWFSNKAFKLSLHRLRRHRSTPPPSPQTSTGSRALEFQAVFRRFDSDGDGKISGEELQSFFSWAGDSVSVAEVERVMRDHDSDGDGLMDFGDFMRLMEMGREQDQEEEDLKRAFEMFETEKGSGRITPGGLQQVLGRLGEARTREECAAMIGAYDLDGNGVLDYQEFHRMMA